MTKLALSQASALAAPVDMVMHILHLCIDGHLLTFVWGGEK
jgi:hypothetical protein